ncbi:MAG: VapC toxin family PIN domain ribonuclease [Actinomycetota bacterium]|nr:type II toxin-antitoxin system VapC family toxin [Acidothermales bacterium]MDQ3432376.1 VapC toxin family PIN domain ribonuclease [Actinomycetota bacterium]
MILADTSVWVDHLRSGDPTLATLLDLNQVMIHPWVIGELALDHLSQRGEVMGLLAHLPQATVATATEVLTLIESDQLHGTGIGYVDAQLLAATRLTPGTRLWTRDRRLSAAAERLGCAADPPAE